MKKLTNNIMLYTFLLLPIIACEFMLALLLLPGVQFSDVYIFIFVNSALAVLVFFYSQVFKRNTGKISTEETKKLKDDIALLNTTLDATNDDLFVINSDGKITNLIWMQCILKQLIICQTLMEMVLLQHNKIKIF